MARSKNVELLRACAILYVMIYHFYVVSGKGVSIGILGNLIGMGGEIGVTMFFVISGFGIYSLLDSEKAKNMRYKDFVVGRWKKLAPQYYVCIIMVVLLTDSAIYISPEHIMQFVSHALFFHSLSPVWSGTINGVLWTMGVLMQFYVLSFFIFKLQKKSVLYVIGLCFLSIFVKFCIYHFWLPGTAQDTSIYYFVYGREIYSALDNFLIGMLAAELIKKHRLKNPILCVGMTLAVLILLGVWANRGYITGIYADNVFSYLWHFICALLCGVLVYTACMIKELRCAVWKPLHWVAKNNYGIYLWHLVITRKVLEYSAWANSLTFWPFVLLMMCLSFVIGYISMALNKSMIGAKS